MCGSTLFHVLRKQNISLYAFVPTKAVLVKKKDEEFLQFFVLFLWVGVLIFILLYRRAPSGLFSLLYAASVGDCGAKVG